MRKIINMQLGGYVYILTNYTNTVLYTGVTSDLLVRVEEHRKKIHPSAFTAKYNCYKLVYFAEFMSIEDAIAEEKRIKGCSRAYKISLIETMNLEWADLLNQVC